jgi:FlaA1/EpsC-like NDP-sugar epimerase
VVRYGNVMGSRGSVIPFFMNKAKSGVLPITDTAMTRFNIPLDEGVEMVFWALEHALGGEILVPKIPSYRIGDVAEAIGPNCKKEIVGIRPGEKLHEEMITSSDSPNTVDLGSYFAILGSGQQSHMDEYLKSLKAQQVPAGFAYESGTNPDFLSVEQIRALIKTHMNPEFEPV